MLGTSSSPLFSLMASLLLFPSRSLLLFPRIVPCQETKGHGENIYPKEFLPPQAHQIFPRAQSPRPRIPPSNHHLDITKSCPRPFSPITPLPNQTPTLTPHSAARSRKTAPKPPSRNVRLPAQGIPQPSAAVPPASPCTALPMPRRCPPTPWFRCRRWGTTRMRDAEWIAGRRDFSRREWWRGICRWSRVCGLRRR